MKDQNFNIDPENATETQKSEYVENILLADDIDKLSNKMFLDKMSLFIDFLFDLKKSEGLDYAIKKMESFFERELSDHDRALGHYYLANAYSNKKSLKINMNDVLSKWENPEIAKEILHYRLALKYLNPIYKTDFPTKKTKGEIFDNNIRYCQINTNLGNLMDNIGRFAEAVEYRNNALSLNPKFGMALGGKGLSYLWYAKYLYDGGHKAYLSHQAYRLFKSSLNCQLEYGAAEQFQKGMQYVKSHIDKIDKTFLDKELYLDSFPLGQSDDEINYRTWCLQNCLFLNPLNDLGPYPIAARDILSIPSIVTKINEGPNCQILFNQLKQEFVTARFIYYQGISGKTVHYSDKEVFLFDTEDCPIYSKTSEEIKCSFRICYSILDKIAFFLNYYLNLGVKEREVYFKTIWYTQRKINKNDQKKPNEKEYTLRPKLTQKNNLPLLGLFWISKDLFEKESQFRDAIEPDAKEWYEIRNHLEHKFLKLHLNDDNSAIYHSRYLGEIDESLTYSIEIHDFERKTIKLLKTVRSALIYLVLAMEYEEFERRQKRDSSIKLAQISLQRFPDDLKTNDYRYNGGH